MNPGHPGFFLPVRLSPGGTLSHARNILQDGVQVKRV
jgi:hypothetical protein